MTISELDRAQADDATASMFDAMTLLISSIGTRGFSRVADGVASYVTGGQLATLNNVLVSAADADPDAVVTLYDEVAATGLPHCVQVRPAAEPHVERLLSERGLQRVEEFPFMVRPGDERPALADDVLEIRALGPGEIAHHIAVAAAGFEVPEEVFADFMKDEAFAVPGVGVYVGSVAGEVVTTGLGIVARGWVGVFDIATPPAHRRRGYGAAITAHVVAEGLAAGANAAYLQSSEAGFGVYERLGFTTVERWSVWMRPEEAGS